MSRINYYVWFAQFWLVLFWSYVMQKQFYFQKHNANCKMWIKLLVVAHATYV